MKRAYLMVVDHDVPARERLTRWLRSSGYVVCSAASADEALELLCAAGRLPDMIFVADAIPEATALYPTLMRSASLSKIAYLIIAARGHDFAVLRPGSSTERIFDPRSLTQLIDRIVIPTRFAPISERRALRA
ncbi:response regulator [Pendulispora rubella]|uniref:Response regulator n=1 Tax=Pendulispora rubella TaxID=2741070 RepID=A0ABZ2L5U4_9BACT